MSRYIEMAHRVFPAGLLDIDEPLPVVARPVEVGETSRGLAARRRVQRLSLGAAALRAEDGKALAH